jgi:hypothetical protein
LYIFYTCTNFIWYHVRGGTEGGGTIIKFIPATNNLTVVKSFAFESLAASPTAALCRQAMESYMDDDYGGSRCLVLSFSFDPSTSTYKKLKDFNRTNGVSPSGSLMQARDGKLYGMTTLWRKHRILWCYFFL